MLLERTKAGLTQVLFGTCFCPKCWKSKQLNSLYCRLFFARNTIEHASCNWFGTRPIVLADDVVCVLRLSLWFLLYKNFYWHETQANFLISLYVVCWTAMLVKFCWRVDESCHTSTNLSQAHFRTSTAWLSSLRHLSLHNRRFMS